MTAVIAGAVVVGALAGCTPETEPMPTPPLSTPTATSSPGPDAHPSPEPEPEVEQTPNFLPGGTALANKAYFDYVNQNLFTQSPGVADIDILAMLAAAGFDKAGMEVTRGKTPTGRKAEAIEFAVRAHDDCLIGQWGKNLYTSYIASVLVDGSCLIGDTRTLS